MWSNGEKKRRSQMQQGVWEPKKSCLVGILCSGRLGSPLCWTVSIWEPAAPPLCTGLSLCGSARCWHTAHLKKKMEKKEVNIFNIKNNNTLTCKFSALCRLLTHVSQRVRIEVVTILQRVVGKIRHEIMRRLSGLKSWDGRKNKE